MKKTGRLIALLLALVMVLSLTAACASSSDSSSDDTDVETEAETQAAETQTTQEETQEDSDVWEGEITEINIYLLDIMGVTGNEDDVVAAMNAITEEKIGVHANVTFLSMGDYDSKLTLAIAGGEQVDLCMITPLSGSGFTVLYASGYLMDITEYLQEDGSETLELVGDYIDAYTVSGSIYGVPVYRNYSSSMYLCMRADILRELDLYEFAENITTWSEVEEIFAAVAENYDIAPIGNNQNVIWTTGVNFDTEIFGDSDVYDGLSDAYTIVYTDDEANVSLLAETEGFRTMVDMVRDWWENGWIYEDSLTVTDHIDTLIGAGVVFSCIEASELGVETSKLSSTGYEMLCVELVPCMMSSSEVNKLGIAVPVTAQEPEVAIRWINELYQNEELMNLIVWGIEGTDYVVTDTGEADYPDGVTSDTVNYHTADYMYGNYFLVLPWAGNGSDFREVAYEALQNAPVSSYLGFSVDQSDLDNELAAINSVTEKYSADILCGNFTDAEYEEWIEALKTAGVEDLLAIYQEQLQEWLAAQSE